METIAPPRRGPRCLRYRWFVAIALAVHLMAETAGAAQANFPFVYDTSIAAPPSHGVTGQPRASLWDPFVQGWDKVQKQLDNRGMQLGIRYDGDVFSDLSGGLRPGATYLGAVAFLPRFELSL